jgi:ribose transport system permease protein
MLSNPSASTVSAPTRAGFDVRRFLTQYSFVVPLLLLILALAINYSLQDNLFELRSLNRNLRTFLPTIIVAVGQTIVIIAGGVDLSVGAIFSMVNAILVTMIVPESSNEQILLAILVGAGAGVLAGFINGLCVAYLRLQPIVTTYATSFLFAGAALLILPRPGGAIPEWLDDLYKSTPLDMPFAICIIAIIIVVWLLLRSTRFGQYLFATGGKAESAYTTGVPVNRIRLYSYMLCGLFVAVAALAYTLLTNSGNPRSGDEVTLISIVAVVLGGTRLSGGQGGVIGSIIGVIILSIFRNIISFADIDSWWQTLVYALIILAALAGPGFIRLLGQVSGRLRLAGGAA